MTDDTRRMVEEAIGELLHALTMCIRQKAVEGAMERIITAVVALVERERAFVFPSHAANMRSLLKRAEAAEKALAEARERPRCRCNCHNDAMREMFQQEHDSCEICLDGLLEEAAAMGRAEGEYLAHHTSPPAAEPTPADAIFNLQADAASMKIRPMFTEPAHKRDGVFDDYEGCESGLDTTPTPERCGTCGSDDPATRLAVGERDSEHAHLLAGECAGSFHSQPPAGKEDK